MREGPPASPSKGEPSAFSASTLVKDITSLRGRLKDLEDDTRSSVCDDQNDLTNMLRKELSGLGGRMEALQNEKAKIEKEFMNQLSVMARENHGVVSNLQAKLVDAENEKELSSAIGGDIRTVRMRVAEEREAHTREIEQMKVNLASADMEIADGRREMDHMHEDVVELRSQKEALFEDVSALKLEVDREKQKSESLRGQLHDSDHRSDMLQQEMLEKEAYINAKHDELGEMNDTIIVLEEHKEMLVSEVTDVRSQLMKEEQANTKLQAKIDDLQTPKNNNFTPPREKRGLTIEIEPPITPAEKEQLEDGVTKLEERLQRMQSKYSEKDKTIDNLAAALSEERKLNKKLKLEMNKLKGKSPECTSPIESRIANEKKKANSISDSVSEMEFLRKQNKILNDEVKSLRVQVNVTSIPTLSRANSPNPRSRRTRSPSPQPRVAQATPMTPPMVSRKAGVGGPRSPRTPVSGIVASYEKRITKRRPAAGLDEESVASLPTALATVAAKQGLGQERETVEELQGRLREEKELVVELRALLAGASTVSSGGLLEAQLQESEQEIQRLRSIVQEYEDMQAEMESEIRKAEVDNTVQEKEIERLRLDLSHALDRSSFQEEKKSEDAASDEELVRLRAQVAALQPELDRTLTDIESLQCEVDRLRKALRAEQLTSLQASQKSSDDEESVSVSVKDQKGYEKELNQLKVALTTTQMSKAELEMEYMASIKELEKEMESLEIETDEELDEKQKELDALKLSLSSKEELVGRLEKEKSHICDSMTNVSFSRKDDMEDLQADLMEATAKTNSQVREIQSLKMKIDDYEVRKDEMEKKTQDRLEELEHEIDASRRSTRAQVSREEFEGMRVENGKLREGIRNVTIERRRLQERLDSLVTDKSSSKSVQVLRDRNSALKKEVEKLTKRLKKMEASITRCAV